MNTNTPPQYPVKPISDSASDLAHSTATTVKETAKNVSNAGKDVMHDLEDAVDDAAHATKDAAKCCSDKAKEIYHSAVVKADDTLVASKDFIRRNPLPVVLGAIAFGAAIGYVLLMPRRKLTFSEHYQNEPLSAVRNAFLGAIAPVTNRVHQGYDSARDGAGKVMNRVHDYGTGRCRNSLSGQVERLGHNLKFW